MDEEAKKKIAQFRFGVIADLVGSRRLCRGERERLLREKSASKWDIPYTGRSYISPSTIKRWVRLYEASGSRLESLYPDDRTDRGKPRAVDGETALALVELRRQLSGITIPAFLKEAQEKGIIPTDFSASHSTIYRLFKAHGVMEKDAAVTDRRRYEAELPNDIWQADCLHGPKVEADGRQRKSYLFAFIDDMSRLIPHAQFYHRENIESFLDSLRKAFNKRGLPRKLYVDNGPSFRSQHLSHIAASLGIALIHSKPYQPEGRGKIERWFKTVRMQFLPTVPAAASLTELNGRLSQWIDTEYHKREHSSTKMPPLKRYIDHIHLIREAPRDMENYFRKRVNRKVDKDRSISLIGRLYEAPVGLIGRTVSLYYHEHDPVRVEVFHNSKSHGMLLPLDVNINCRVRRDAGVTEIIADNNNQTAPDEIDNYRGGSLFEGGQDDGEL